MSIAQSLKPAIHCMLCHMKHHQFSIVCEDCLRYFPKLGACCQTCAEPLPDIKPPRCGQCIRHPPAIDRVMTHYQYQEPLRTLLHQFKYHEGLYLTSFITQLMIEALPSQYQTECIIPVPVHIKRLQERGFNHALLLSKPIARHLKCQLEHSICQKIIHTSPQAALKARTRQHNLHNAYTVKRTHYQHVTVVDDLITTGNTAHKMAMVLKQSGIKQVNLLCFAKTCRDARALSFDAL